MEQKTTFTISGANKGVRTAFGTIDEAKAHITKNKLFPSLGNKHITITETTVTEYIVKTELPQISSESKAMLVDSAKRMIAKGKEIHWDFSPESYVYQYYMHGIKAPINDIIAGIAKKLSGKDDMEFEKDFQKREFRELCDNPTELQKWTRENNKEMAKELVNYVLENPDELSFMATKTNYKPCNAICLVYGDPNNRNMVIQLREDNMVVSSSYLYGRKVSLTSVSALDEETLKKFNSKIIK